MVSKVAWNMHLAYMAGWDIAVGGGENVNPHIPESEEYNMWRLGYSEGCNSKHEKDINHGDQ